MADPDGLTESERREVNRTIAETLKLMAESRKLDREARWPPVIVAAIIVAGLGVVSQLVTAYVDYLTITNP